MDFPEANAWPMAMSPAIRKQIEPIRANRSRESRVMALRLLFSQAHYSDQLEDPLEPESLDPESLEPESLEPESPKESLDPGSEALSVGPSPALSRADS
jgi:hypothetical protein